MIIAILIVAFVAIVWIYMQQPQFGKAPGGARLERIRQSPNYRDGAFQNQSITPALAEGTSYFSVFRKFFFGKSKRVIPVNEIPARKIDLKSLSRDQDILVWFGHSSYFMQIDGKRILVDPVMSGHASPVSFTTKKL